MPTPRTYLNAYLRGAITPIEKAAISILSHGFQHGTSVSADIEAYQMGNSVGIFCLDGHLADMRRRCEEGRLAYEMDVDAIKHAIITLIARNRPTGVVFIRLLIYRADSPGASGNTATYDLAMYLRAASSDYPTEHGLAMYLHPELFTHVPIRQYCPGDIAEKGF